MKMKTCLTIAALAAAFTLSACESMNNTSTTQPSSVRTSSTNSHAGTAGAPQPKN